MKAKKILFVIFSALTLLLMLAVLELNRNALWGFALLAVITAGFYILHRRIVKSGGGVKKLGLWCLWIALFIGVVLISWPRAQAVPAVEAKDPQKTEVIALDKGQVRGVYNADQTVAVYAGIPYAKPPVGELRWREPQDAEPWNGVLEANTFAPMSMQPTNLPIYDSLAQIIGYHDYQLRLDDQYVAPVSEDSLYVNVWRPAQATENAPVLVYIHGGSLKTGQPWYGDYNGETLAREGVIVVNMGYRLGIFGYYADAELAAESPNGTTGNYGLLDQIKALEWVRDNIAAFGGDPDNVTVAGESAGAASVSALCTSPLASGLFRRVILESSTVAPVHPPHSFRLMNKALQSGAETKEKYGCTTVAELRALPAEKLVAEAETHHHITVDGYALEKTPYESYRAGEYNEEAILHGYNSRESGPFLIFDRTTLGNFEQKVRSYFGDAADAVLALYPAETDSQAAEYWAEIFGAAFFDYPHYCLNRLAAENGIDVYEYYFARNNGRLGPWHSGEEVYCYGNIPDSSSLYDARDRELSRQMVSYWRNFAVSGDPNSEGLPQWEENTDSDTLMLFGDTTEMMPEREHALFAVLDGWDGWEDPS